MLMIPGGKGPFELAIRNLEANHHYMYAPLIFGCQDARAAVNSKSDFYLRKLRSLPRIRSIMPLQMAVRTKFAVSGIFCLGGL